MPYLTTELSAITDPSLPPFLPSFLLSSLPPPLLPLSLSQPPPELSFLVPLMGNIVNGI